MHEIAGLPVESLALSGGKTATRWRVRAARIQRLVIKGAPTCRSHATDARMHTETLGYRCVYSMASEGLVLPLETTPARD